MLKSIGDTSWAQVRLLPGHQRERDRFKKAAQASAPSEDTSEPRKGLASPSLRTATLDPGGCTFLLVARPGRRPELETLDPDRELTIAPRLCMGKMTLQSAQDEKMSEVLAQPLNCEK
jgi:hypothetical protein